jgi:hypothetical protein
MNGLTSVPEPAAPEEQPGDGLAGRQAVRGAGADLRRVAAAARPAPRRKRRRQQQQVEGGSERVLPAAGQQGAAAAGVREERGRAVRSRRRPALPVLGGH